MDKELLTALAVLCRLIIHKKAQSIGGDPSFLFRLEVGPTPKYFALRTVAWIQGVIEAPIKPATV